MASSSGHTAGSLQGGQPMGGAAEGNLVENCVVAIYNVSVATLEEGLAIVNPVFEE